MRTMTGKEVHWWELTPEGKQYVINEFNSTKPIVTEKGLVSKIRHPSGSTKNSPSVSGGGVHPNKP